MGLFDNETQIVVGVSTQRLLEGKSTELRDTCIDAILNGKDIGFNLKGTLTSGLKSSVMNYHRIISKLQNYSNTLIYDFPEMFPLNGTYEIWRNTKSFVYSYSLLINLFWNKTGKTHLLFTKCYWTNRIYPYHYLKADYMPNFMGWNPTTKEIADIPNDIIALGSVSKVTWAGLPTTVILQPWGCELYFTIHFSNGTTKEYTYIPININNWMDANKSLLVFEYGTDEAAYIELSDIDDDNILAEITNSTTSVNNKYIPTVSVRRNSINLVDQTNNDNLKPVKKALDIIGVDIQSITDSIMSTEGGNDPNKIDDAFIGFGVSPATKSVEGKNYLFEFFGYLTTNVGMKRTKADWEYFLQNYNSQAQNFFIKGQYCLFQLNGGESNNYKHTIRYLYAEHKSVVGSIGEVNKVTTEIVVRPKLKFGSTDVDDSSFIIRKQINTGVYVEIEVRGLIWVGETYPDVVAKYYLSDYQEAGKNHIYFPIITGLLKNFGIFEQTSILYESMILTVYAKDEIKIPWYLTASFLNLVQIVVLVVSLFTFNPQGSTFAALIKELGYQAIKQIILAKIFAVVVKGLVSVLGYEKTAVLIALATVYGLGTFALNTKSTWAIQLLQASSLAQNSFNNVIKEDLINTLQETENFNEKYLGLMDEIQKVKDQFAPSILPILSRRYVFAFNPNETPTQFFNRTVHTTNVGVLSLDDASTFVERMLQLPKNSDFG